MFKLLLICLSLTVLVGCYEVRYQAPIQINGTFEAKPDSNETPKSLCMDITYRLKSNSIDVVETEHKCVAGATLSNGQLVSKFNFSLNKKADVYDILNVSNIELRTELTANSNCTNCAATTLERTYTGGLTQLNNSEATITANLVLSLTNETSKQKWVSSYEEVVKGCYIFNSEAVRLYCIQLNTRPELAKTCFNNTRSVNEERECLRRGSLEH